LEPFYFKYKEGLEKTAAPKFLTKEGETGLTFEYFNGKNFEEFVGSKTRDTLYLHALGSPYKGVARDGFSVRISGVMIPSKTGTYQAKVDGDDGVRLYIDGKLIIDEWKADDSFHANYTTIKLEAGKKYEIKHEFFDNISGAFTRFAFTNLDGTQAEVEAVKNVDKSRSVYLPGNTKWFDFWTGKTFEGGQTITAAAPIETMPLFVKAGSIVPMGPVVQYATEKTDAPVVIRVYPGADGEFTLYDDENDNYNYEKGQFSTINLKWLDKEKILTIGQREGTFNGMETTRKFNIIIVSELKGKGIETENMPDMTIEYKGDALIIPIK
jgi:alpha-D-xyloside xylohydrolase